MKIVNVIQRLETKMNDKREAYCPYCSAYTLNKTLRVVKHRKGRCSYKCSNCITGSWKYPTFKTAEEAEEYFMKKYEKTEAGGKDE